MGLEYSEGSITAVLVPHSTPPPQYHENRLGRGQKRQGGVKNGSFKIHTLVTSLVNIETVAELGRSSAE